jgi:integrase
MGPRTLALTGELAELIARCRAKRKGPLVFHHEGKPIVDLRKAWRTAVKAAGCPNAIFHDLRRSGVREMILAGVSPQVAKTISGHETDSMLNRYCVLNTEDQRRALDQRAAYVAQQLQAAPAPQQDRRALVQ